MKKHIHIAPFRLIAVATLLATLIPCVNAAEKYDTRRQTITADFTRNGTVSSRNDKNAGLNVQTDEYTIKVPAGRKAIVSITRTGGFIDGTEEFYVYAFDEYQHYLQFGETRIYTFTADNIVTLGANGSSDHEVSIVNPWKHLEYSVFVDYTIAIAYAPNDLPPGGYIPPVTLPEESKSLYPTGNKTTFRSIVRDSAGTITGYRDGVLGILQLSAFKLSRSKGTAKVTGTINFFDNTRSTFSVIVNVSADGKAWVRTPIKNHGTLDVLVSEAGVCGSLDGSCEIERAKIGGTVNGSAQFIMEQTDFWIKGADRMFFGLLPDGEPVEIAGRKWITAKQGKVKDIMGSATDADIEGDNLAGLKLTYNDKTGEIKGSFTVYAMSKGRLAKHKATICGALINDRGRCLVSIKKASWVGVASIVGR